MSQVPTGKFVWYDLMTTDPAAAQDFYTKVIGWGTETWEGAEEPYDMWTNARGPLGGVMQLPEEARAQGAPPHWLAYIAVEDVDATVAKATELGGNVLMPPMDIPEVGRFAVLADPAGAVIAAFRPEGEAPGPDGMPGVGEMSWHELMTDDYNSAFEFYAALFGWEKTTAMDMGEAGVYQMYGRGVGGDLGGMMNRPPEVPVSCWTFYTRVEDIDETIGRVTDNGGTVLNGPMDVPGGDKVAQCLDPQGANVRHPLVGPGLTRIAFAPGAASGRRVYRASREGPPGSGGPSVVRGASIESGRLEFGRMLVRPRRRHGGIRPHPVPADRHGRLHVAVHPRHLQGAKHARRSNVLVLHDLGHALDGRAGHAVGPEQ